MPTYDYHCPANGRTVEVSHKLTDRIATCGRGACAFE
jgi:predicted nucleic acid-binding Zn ribbon protein